MGNTFMASAAKSKRKQKSIERVNVDTEELVCINIRIPNAMRQKLRQHFVDTGENMTQLINRLLAEELG